MRAVKRNARHFKEEVHECPQNAGLFPDGELYAVLRDGSSTLADKRAAKAELAVRMFLSRRRFSANMEKGLPDVETLLNDWIGPDVLLRFFEKAETCGLCTDYRQRIDGIFRVLEVEGRSFDDADAEAIRRAFRPWFEAEGVIPVFNESGTYLLPFCFRDGRSDIVVEDASGNIVNEWTQCLRILQRDCGITKSVQVAFHQNEFVQADGNSLMLPLVMAWNRKYVEAGCRLPRYNPIRFVATGAIVGGRLAKVSTEEKLKKISDDVDNGFLIRPGNGRDEGTIREDERIEDVLQTIRERAELDYDTAPNNACSRLRSLDRVVRQRYQGDWERMNRRLDRLSESIDEYEQDEEYLNAIMLRSAARCHSGQTEEARRLNEKAIELARGRPEYASRLLRLQVEELVILQDEEDFDRIYSLAGPLEARIIAYCDTHTAPEDRLHCLDLQMRYYGTIGQFEAYAALAGLPGHSKEAAKRYFEKALECARGKSRKNWDGQDEEYFSSVADCAQDANYLLLWHALFDEQNMMDESVHLQALKCAKKLHDQGWEDDAEKNDSFRRRYAALGVYRAVLKGVSIPDVADDLECAAETGNEWVRATVGKYLGAVAAKQGRHDDAQRRFDKASSLLIGKKGILGEIHMSVLAEAYRSMRSLDADYAEQRRQDALQILRSPDITCLNREAWKNWLESEGTDDDFPGLKFWY